MESTDDRATQEIAELYAAHGPAILRYLERLTGQHETAEDLAQETFLKAWRAWGQRTTQDAVGTRAWLFRIATTTAYDEFRRQRRRPTTPLTELHVATLAAPGGLPFEEAEMLGEVLRELSDEHRTALLLQGYAGYPLAQIAARLGWKEGTVKSRLHRARAQAQQHFAAYSR